MMRNTVALLFVIGLAAADNEAVNPRIPDSCSIVMAPSSIPDAGWGVFTLIDKPEGSALLPGDVVVQVSDLNETYGGHANRLAYDYGWDAAVTGGQFEGKTVLSVMPGIGMLANGLPRSFNALPAVEPNVDEAEVTRQNSAGAGAFTHYHNQTFVAQQELKAGMEILVNYGPISNEQRALEVEGSAQKLERSVESLLEEGFCLDNMQPGQSTNPNAGRGAFTTRSLPKGSIVAPVPVLPITKREAMDTTRTRPVAPGVTRTHTTPQLLLNYLYGHPKSSVLLAPYSPIVNLINHSKERSNVKLRWSSVNQQHEDLTLEDLEKINSDASVSNGELLLELEATRDLAEGEELFLDYGDDWQTAWESHERNWEAFEREYAPAYVMDEATPVLATNEEQSATPYPPNLMTSCFYRHFHNPEATRNITKSEWEFSNGLFQLRNLRPCTIMQRIEVEKEDSEADKEPTFSYTVVIRNRYGLPPQERIPAGHMHVVTNVPRRAIRFTDKTYTTDQHLAGAFRKEIGLGDLFPSQWLDKEEKEHN